MSDDQIFRFVLVTGILAILPVGLYFRIRSQATRESLDRTQEGWFILIFLRLFALGFAVGAVAFVVDPESMRWGQVPLPASVRWLGAPLGVAAGLLIIWTFRTLGPNLTDTVVTRKNHELVTGGPYRWVRHPFYLAFFLAVMATTLLTANLYLAATSGIAFAFIVARTRVEEEKLIERFGNDYRALMARTNRFLPRRPIDD